MLFRPYQLTGEKKELAEKFNEKNDHLLEDIKKVYGHMQELLGRKQEALERIDDTIKWIIRSRNNYRPIVSRDYLDSSVKYLNKVLRTEERYLHLVFEKLMLFMGEAEKIKNDCKKIYPRPLAKFANLSSKYLVELLKMCRLTEKTLNKAISLNSKQLRYADKCERKIAKNKLPLDFIAEFNGMHGGAISEKEAKVMLSQLENAQKEMRNVQSVLVEFYNAHSVTFKFMVNATALGVYFNIINGNMYNGLVKICLDIATLLLLSYLTKRPDLKKIIGAIGARTQIPSTFSAPFHK